MSTRPMVSVALEANRKRFPWVKINIFFKKMVKADWGGKKKKKKGGGMREIQGGCGGGDMKQWSGMKIERQRKKGDKQRGRENRNV